MSSIRVCDRCGRGAVELKGEGGESLVVKLDPVRTRQLTGTIDDSAPRTLLEVTFAGLATEGLAVSEVVFDSSEGRLGALVTLLREEDSEIVACTAEEGVAVAMRAGVKIYATDEALSHAAARSAKPASEGSAGGSDTIH